MEEVTSPAVPSPTKAEGAETVEDMWGELNSYYTVCCHDLRGLALPPFDKRPGDGDRGEGGGTLEERKGMSAGTSTIGHCLRTDHSSFAATGCGHNSHSLQ